MPGSLFHFPKYTHFIPSLFGLGIDDKVLIKATSIFKLNDWEIFEIINYVVFCIISV